MTDDVIETEVSTSDITNDAPATTEEAKVEVEKQEPETVTLTKAELEEQKNAVAAKERARAERKSERAMQAMKADFDARFESLNSTPKVVEGKPSLDKYETYDEYVDALTDWKIDQKSIERESKARVEKENQSRASLMKEHDAREEKARKTMPDYDVVTGNLSDAGFDINPDIGRAIVSSDLSPELIYYFGKDLDELERINNLSPMSAAREIGKIEAMLLAEPIQTSSAPNPITPVGQSKATITKDPEKMTDAEWYAQQLKEKKRK
jgi:hypothetical protein